jgi:hypothetical protein
MTMPAGSRGDQNGRPRVQSLVDAWDIEKAATSRLILARPRFDLLAFTL